jgi:hypothetical protein
MVGFARLFGPCTLGRTWGTRPFFIELDWLLAAVVHFQGVEGVVGQ